MKEGERRRKRLLICLADRWVVRLLLCIAVACIWTAGGSSQTRSLGQGESTIIPGQEDGQICAGATLLQQDDGDFENGYTWESFGVVAPEYGSWAECYDSDFACGVQFYFTQIGYYVGQTMDVYVWESVADGNPPPGPDPGNVIFMLADLQPGAIAFWPEISVHDVRVCTETDGPHFVGYWPNWPGQGHGWFIAVDEDGMGDGCPRTKAAPGLGYPTGWQHPSIIAMTWEDCKDLGIREYAGPGDCPPTRVQTTGWGAIKALYSR